MVPVTPFRNTPDSSNDLSIFKMSCISSLKTIRVVAEPLPYIFFCTPAFIAELAAVRPNRARGFMTDFNNGNPVFNNGSRSLLKNPPD